MRVPSAYIRRHSPLTRTKSLKDTDEHGQPRKLRADAERNRLKVLEAAKRAFAERGADASLDEIARAAGVGAGTLYRHFENRDELIAAVYLKETRQLADAAASLATDHPPVQALRAWLRVFIDYIVTKRAMVVALQSMTNGPSALYSHSWEPVRAEFGKLVQAAIQSGDIQVNLDLDDWLKALAIVASTDTKPDPTEGANRLADVLLAGMQRTAKPAAS